MAKYFHELTDEEFEALKATDITWGEVAKIHPQPTWCEYPRALEAEMGCWSLVYRKGVSKEFCKNCDLFNESAPNTACTGLAGTEAAESEGSQPANQ
jgi:hypothetical protein